MAQSRQSNTGILDMKVLIINGSPHKKGTTYTALAEVDKILLEEGIDTVWYDVPSDTASCMACSYCHKERKGCIRKDCVNDAYSLLDEADGLIVGSPVYYAGPSGSLLSFLDRLFYSYPSKKKFKMMAAAAVSNSRRAGNITSNDVILKFFSISGMAVITSTYWNDPHGFTPDDLKKDEEALQTMRNLGRNMAYYLRMRAMAKENGLKEPEIEKQHSTHFIR